MTTPAAVRVGNVDYRLIQLDRRYAESHCWKHARQLPVAGIPIYWWRAVDGAIHMWPKNEGHLVIWRGGDETGR
jgi:hypothetical protein